MGHSIMSNQSSAGPSVNLLDYVQVRTHCFLYLFESTVQVELPPIEMVGIEREIIILATVTGVGQNVAATFGEAQKDMSVTK